MRFLINTSIAGLILLLSCDSSRVFEVNKRIENGAWSSQRAMHFEVQIQDTVSPHNIFINLRNSGNYGYSNLFLFVETTAPSGQSLVDTLECYLADETGKWYGNGLGNIYFLQVPFKQNVIFPLTGIYTFDVVQAMRTDPLEGIEDVGLRVESGNQK
jgi:gliding motility-associated lipoprotein GldH